MIRLFTVGAMGSVTALNDNHYARTGVVLIITLSPFERERHTHDDFNPDQLI